MSLKSHKRARRNLLFLKLATDRLREAGVVSASSEAEAILRHYGRIERLDFYAGNKTLGRPARHRARLALQRRVQGRPLQHVLRTAEFLGIRLRVNRDVLIPRPETELLAEKAIEILSGQRDLEVLDVGTGSGCIALSLTGARTDCRMTALDISPRALKVARENARRLGQSPRIRFVQSDLFRAFRKNKAWDLIVCNPPYIPSGEIPGLSREVRQEPLLALDGGGDGLAVVSRLLEEAPGRLEAGGWLLMEMGAGQRGRVASLMSPADWADVKFMRDYAGIDRILVARKHG